MRIHAHIVLLAIHHQPARPKENGTVHCIGAGIIVWFITEAELFNYHTASSVLINTVFLLIVFLLLVIIRKHFIKGKHAPDKHIHSTLESVIDSC